MAFEYASPPVRFCPIRESDLARINELSNMPEIAGHFETIPPVPLETTMTLWHHIRNGIVSFWGVRVDDRIIGGAGFYAPLPGNRLSHAATFFLFLEPAFWGKGIGRMTLSFLENEVRMRGYLRMECLVVAGNLRAIRLYELNGYNREGVKKQAYFIDGEYVDLVIMGKVFL